MAITFLFGCGFTKAQETTTWTFHKEAFTFKVRVDSIPYKGVSKHQGQAVSSIDIVDAKTHQVVQTITPNRYQHASFLDSATIVKLEDINFDGYIDIGVLSWTSTTIQKTYDFWVFEEDKELFKRDSTLDTIWNPAFFPEHKVVYSNWRVGVNEAGHAIYKYEPNKLTCLVEKAEYWGIDPKANGTLETTVLRNGQPVKTEFDIQDRDQGIESWDVKHLLEMWKL